MRLIAYCAVAGLTAGVLLPQGSFAADILGPLRSTLKAAPGEDTSLRWYLRGDIMRSWYRNPKSQYTIVSTTPNIGPVEFRNEKIRPLHGASVGAGLRYRFLRFDMTCEARNAAQWSAYTPPFNNWNYVGPFPVPARRDHISFTSRSVMANIYGDLSSWHGVTPYVGAGIGVTRFKTSGLYISNPLPQTAALGGAVQTLSNGKNKSWSPSWALMAGFILQVTQHAAIDLGYRYINLGRFKYNHFDPATGQVFTILKTRNIVSQDIRLGFRYQFGKPKQAARRNTFAVTPKGVFGHTI